MTIHEGFYQLPGEALSCLTSLVRHDIKVLNCRGSTKIGGGLPYLIGSDVPYSVRELSHLNASNSDIEIQWIVLKLKMPSR